MAQNVSHMYCKHIHSLIIQNFTSFNKFLIKLFWNQLIFDGANLQMIGNLIWMSDSYLS